MKTWTRESKQYFDTVREARLGADYENTAYKKFNGVHYDKENGKFYVSYIYKF